MRNIVTEKKNPYKDRYDLTDIEENNKDDIKLEESIKKWNNQEKKNSIILASNH